MAYKRNPMRSERIASLSRYVMADALNPALTASAQWFERTLDDSANKRVSVPEAFLAVDGILALYNNIISGLTVYPKIIARHLADELPFMATEDILMYCVKRGGDRQALHEAIREHSVAAGRAVKAEGDAKRPDHTHRGRQPLRADRERADRAARSRQIHRGLRANRPRNMSRRSARCWTAKTQPAQFPKSGFETGRIFNL